MSLLHTEERRRFAGIVRAEIVRRGEIWRDRIGQETADNRTIVAGKAAADIAVWHMLLAWLAFDFATEIEPVRFGGFLSFALEDHPDHPWPETAQHWLAMLAKAQGAARNALTAAEGVPARSWQAREMVDLRNALQIHFNVHIATAPSMAAQMAAAERQAA